MVTFPRGFLVNTISNLVVHHLLISSTSSPNIATPVSTLRLGLTSIKSLLTFLHLPTDKLSVALQLEGFFSNVFRIPSDADDSGCNAALGFSLLPLASKFPQSVASWSSYNSFDNSLPNAYLSHAYQPFSNDSDRNSIDTRTYFWIRHYLDTLEGREVKLISTWMQDISDIQSERAYRKMPGNVNNVDVSVVANSLNGLVSLIRHNGSVLTPSLLQLVNDNVDLLVWVLESDLVPKRSVLLLLYYPSRFAFYWFCARLNHILATLPSNSPLKHTAERLASANQKFATQQLLSLATPQLPYMFWDDFLGNRDGKFEDRTFSTAMALNALMGKLLVGNDDY